MPRYVILGDHSPDICPSSNARSRARAIEGMGQDLPKLSEEAGVTFLTGPLHLDRVTARSPSSRHRNVQAVVQLVYDSGLSQWNTVEVCPTRPVAEMMGDPARFPIVFE